MRFKSNLQRISAEYHMQIHLLVGVFLGVLVHLAFPESNSSRVFLAAVLGSFIPDLDHFLFFYIYGKHTPYAKKVKSIYKEQGFKKVAEFCRDNHKHNTQLLSHNILFVMSSIVVGMWFLNERDSISMFTFMMAWCFHYLFDIFEDYLFFGRLNPNWLLRFKQTFKD